MSITPLKLTLLAALCCGGINLSFAQAPAKEQEAKLIAVLTSNAQYQQKADACRELAHVATAASVPALAAMLADEKLSHMARYGLETIPGPEADAALREALTKLKGLPLIGVIGSIGVRHDEKAVPALVAFLKDADADVAQAAARALGTIGTVEAATGLTNALANAPAANQLALCDGLFRCAESLTAHGDTTKAIALYDALLALKPVPHQVYSGALRGAILNRDVHDSRLLLAAAFNSTNPAKVAAAVRIAMEMKAPGASETLVALLKSSPVDLQLKLCNVLGKRGDAATLQALLHIAKVSDKTVRVAAIIAIGEIGHPVATAQLIELLNDSEGTIAQAAMTTLASLPGPQVDARILTSLDTANPTLQQKLIELIRQRRLTAAVPQLLKLMDDKDNAVKSAAVKCYAELGGEAEFAGLVEKLVKASDAATISALEKALTTICAAPAQQQKCTPQIIAALPKASPEAKQPLLRILCACGGSEALKAVRAAIDDSNKDVHSAAIRVLGDWKSAEAAPVLLDLAKSSAAPVDKILTLRGFLGMAARKEPSVPDKIAICRNAAPLIQRNEEKILLLGALGTLADATTLDLAATYLDDAAVKREAVAAVMSIAEKRQPNQQVAITRSALEKVKTAAADNPAVVEKAQALLKKMETEK